MLGYYLGIKIEAVEPRQPDGWRRFRWPKEKKYPEGKICRHWADQVKTEPWGKVSLP